MPELNRFQHFYQSEVRKADAEKHEAKFRFQLNALGISGLEYHVTDWAPGRRLELDVAHRGAKLGAEVQGGAHGQAVYCQHCHRQVMRQSKGKWVPVRQALGHGRADSLRRDYEKFVIAQTLGWFLIPVHPDAIEDGSAAQLFYSILKSRSTTPP
jgi:hypothetical protein